MNIREIFRLYAQGRSKLSISEQLGASRTTVIDYIKQFLAKRLTVEQVDQMSDHELYKLFEPELVVSPRLRQLQELFPVMDKELRKVGVDKNRLWKKYKADHPDGLESTQFYEHFNRWKKQSSPVLRFEHKAGDKLFVDFTGKKLHVVDKATGEVREVEVYVATLGASQLTYVQAVESQCKEDFLNCVENSFHYMGGVPRAVIPDNLKSAVKKVCNYEPILNESFAQLLAYYGCVGMPARRRKPKDKALVEGAVKIVYKRIYADLNERVFTSLEDLNKAIMELLVDYNNELFTERPYSRRDFFEDIERKALQELPTERYQPMEYARATVTKFYHVHLRKDDHYYSVPYHYIGKKVRIAYTPSRVEVYQGYKLIAEHPRIKSPRNYSTLAEHMPPEHRFVKGWNKQYFEDRAQQVGPYMLLLVKGIMQRWPHPEQGYKSCMGVINMASRYGKQRAERACGLSLQYEQYNFNTLKRILEQGWDLMEEEKDIPLPKHDNIRGEKYYK